MALRVRCLLFTRCIDTALIGLEGGITPYIAAALRRRCGGVAATYCLGLGLSIGRGFKDDTVAETMGIRLTLVKHARCHLLRISFNCYVHSCNSMMRYSVALAMRTAGLRLRPTVRCIAAGRTGPYCICGLLGNDHIATTTLARVSRDGCT